MRLRQRKKNVRKFLVEKKKHYLGKGVHYIYHLPDGNRVSVIKFQGPVIKIRGEESLLRWGSYGAEVGLYELYDMYRNDVRGYLTQKAVINYLERALKR